MAAVAYGVALDQIKIGGIANENANNVSTRCVGLLFVCWRWWRRGWGVATVGAPGLSENASH
jgi:hypothetical protein